MIVAFRSLRLVVGPRLRRFLPPAYVCLLVVLVLASPARRVGDGVEYWAMAENLSRLRPPAPSAQELEALEIEAARIGCGFESSPLRFPRFVGRDGRQDFPHFWLYPIVNVPALLLARAAGFAPDVAFTLTNIVLLTAAMAFVARRRGPSWSLLLLAGPILWWTDKVHGDVFTFSLVAVACAAFDRSPFVTLAAMGAAAAQNPALVPVWAVWAAAQTWMHGLSRTRPVSTGDDMPATRRRLIAGLAAGAFLVALPAAYYAWHLGRLAPLVDYTSPSWPSPRTLAAFLVDPNIGLVAAAPFTTIAAVVAGVALARHRARPGLAGQRIGIVVAAVSCVLMLVAFSQSTNINHGGTPGVNRWTLWLLPLGLLWVVPAGAIGRAAPVIGLLAALQIAWSLSFFRPSLPERYRYPSPLAAWLWKNAPSWYSPPAEIFGERVSHREPAVVPTATERCEKVLAVGGRWPLPCLPPADVPPACLRRGSACYANATRGGWTFVPVRHTFGPVAFPRRVWRASGPEIARLRALVRADAGDRALRISSISDAAVRAIDGASWAAAWSGSDRELVYLNGTSEGASVRVRLEGRHRVSIVNLVTGDTLQTYVLETAGNEPAVIDVPAPLAHAAIVIDRL